MKTMRKSRLRIAPGTEDDVSEILELIRGLARYEKLRVRATTRRLHHDGFRQRPYFYTLIARRREQVIGFALYFFTYSTFLARPTLYIEDLFVLPEYRGSGTGTALMRELARIALKRRCGRMEWAVLDWNTPAIKFYERIGARLRKECVLTRLTGTALRRFARKK
jgi:GNAT superfamily N-acetyltransferase